MDVNSVAVRITVRTSGAGNASAFKYSPASVGFDGRGSGPVRGSRGGCEVIARLSLSSLYRWARARNFRKDDQSQAESHRTVERRDRLDHDAGPRPAAGVRRLRAHVPLRPAS